MVRSYSATLICMIVLLAWRPGDGRAAPAARGAGAPAARGAAAPPAKRGAGAPAARGAATSPAKRPGGRAVALPLFKKGIAKFDDGYYREAIDFFRKALFHYPSPKIHTRIALCYKWLDNNLKALEHYETYLRQAAAQGLMDKERVLVAKVRIEVRNLLRTIGQVRIVAERPAGAEVRVNGKLVGKTPLRRIVRLKAGRVNVTVIRKGYYAFRRDLDVPGGKVTPVKVTLLKIRPKVVKVRVGKAYWKQWWFWTTMGVVAAGLATGASLGYYYGRPKRDLAGYPISHDSLGVRW